MRRYARSDRSPPGKRSAARDDRSPAGRPATLRQRPVAGTAGDPAMTQQKPQELLAACGADRPPPPGANRASSVGPAWRCLFTGPPACRSTTQPPPANLLSPPTNRTSLPRRPSAIATACLVFVESDKGFAMLPMARPPCTRLGCANPTNPRLSCARNGGPPAPPRDITSSCRSRFDGRAELAGPN